MNERLRAALARKIAAHNRFVKLTSVWSGLLVVGMWMALYFLAKWAIVFMATILHGPDVEAPRHLWIGFTMVSILWMLVAWVERARIGSANRPERTIVGAFIDLLLAPPRATLAVVENAQGRVVFTELELNRATVFLDRIGRAGKIPVGSIEQELPDADTREHILESLQFINLVCARRSRNGECLYPANPQSLVKFLNP